PLAGDRGRLVPARGRRSALEAPAGLEPVPVRDPVARCLRLPAAAARAAHLPPLRGLPAGSVPGAGAAAGVGRGHRRGPRPECAEDGSSLPGQPPAAFADGRARRQAGRLPPRLAHLSAATSLGAVDAAAAPLGTGSCLTQLRGSEAEYVNALSLYYIARVAKQARLPLVPRFCEGLIFLFFN